MTNSENRAPAEGDEPSDEQIITFLDAFQNDRKLVGDYEAFRGVALDIWQQAQRHPQPKGTEDGHVAYRVFATKEPRRNYIVNDRLTEAERQAVEALGDRIELLYPPGVQSPAPAPGLHYPDTPNKAAFDALYLSLCERPITIHETARRCWKAGFAQGQAAPSPAVVDGLIGGEDPEVIRQKLRTLDVTMGGDGESALSEVIDAATRCLSQQDAVAWRMNLHEGTNAEPRWYYVEMGSPVPGKFKLQKVYTRPQSETLRQFLYAAAGEGFELGGVDAGELFMELFPDYFEKPQPPVQPMGGANG